MDPLFSILMSAIFINNFVLSRFLGICPFIGVSKSTRAAFGMGMAVTFVMLIAGLLTRILYSQVLIPFRLEYLDIIVFIFVIASMVQLVEIFMRALAPSLYRMLGIYLPLITTNCAILGLAFLNINKDYSIIASLVHSLGAGIGFSLALLLMSGIRERLELSATPRPFKGVPIAFITAAIMSLAFLSFAAIK